MPETQLRSTTARPTRRTHLLLDDRTDGHLSASVSLYADMLGRPVSTSVVMRRALGLLVRHLRSVKSEAAVQAEQAALFNAAR